MQERRKRVRYRLDAEITVEGAVGRTIDVSANSVYFELPHAFTPGATLSLIFPFEYAEPGSVVNCRAHVVRVDERAGGMFGIAATFEPVGFNVPA